MLLTAVESDFSPKRFSPKSESLSSPKRLSPDTAYSVQQQQRRRRSVLRAMSTGSGRVSNISSPCSAEDKRRAFAASCGKRLLVPEDTRGSSRHTSYVEMELVQPGEVFDHTIAGCGQASRQQARQEAEVSRNRSPPFDSKWECGKIRSGNDSVSRTP